MKSEEKKRQLYKLFFNNFALSQVDADDYADTIADSEYIDVVEACKSLLESDGNSRENVGFAGKNCTMLLQWDYEMSYPQALAIAQSITQGLEFAAICGGPVVIKKNNGETITFTAKITDSAGNDITSKIIAENATKKVDIKEILKDMDV